MAQNATRRLAKTKTEAYWKDVLPVFLAEINKTNGEFSKSELMRLFNEDRRLNKGEAFREMLDALVCDGKLIKPQFNCGKKGHRWQKIENGNECPFFKLNQKKRKFDGECTYDFSMAKIVRRGD